MSFICEFYIVNNSVGKSMTLIFNTTVFTRQY